MSNSLPESLFKAIGLKESDWNQLLKEAPEGQDPIYWAFKNNKLSEKKYFSLAKEIYPFAHLKSDILQSDVWKEFKSNLKSPILENGYVKFYSWDNVDYFLGTRPPAETFQKNTCFFFAPTAVLDDFYAKTVVNSAEKVSSDPAVVIESVEQDTVTHVDAAAEEAPEGIDLSGIELPDLPEETASEQSAEEVLDAPEGFSDSQVSQLDNSSNDSTDSPEGLSLSGTEPEAEVAPEGLSIKEESSENVLSFEQTAPAPAPAPAQNATQNTEFEKLQTQLNNVFKEAILFSYENGKFQPINHSEKFKPKAKDAIPTDSPSAFRIVAQTQQVYLGHLVKTEVNDSFVNAWFPDGTPNKVLIQPIMVSNKLAGAYLAVCNNGLDNHSLARKGEDLAKEMTSNWPQNYSSAA